MGLIKKFLNVTKFRCNHHKVVTENKHRLKISPFISSIFQYSFKAPNLSLHNMQCLIRLNWEKQAVWNWKNNQNDNKCLNILFNTAFI